MLVSNQPLEICHPRKSGSIRYNLRLHLLGVQFGWTFFTHHFALEYLKRKRPRVVYISYGETDDFAHDHDYDHYLNAAHRTDAFISDLWNWVQSNADYQNKTGVCDYDGSRPREIKIAGLVMGWIGSVQKTFGWHSWGQVFHHWVKLPGGEPRYQNQIASTVAYLLGLTYTNRVAVGESVLK